MPSEALRELTADRLPEIKALFNLDQSRGLGSQSDPVRTNAINRAASVLLAAHLQGYVEALCVETVDWLNRENVEKADVPRALLAAHIEQHLGAVMAPTQLVDRLTRLERLFDDKAMYWSDCTVGPDQLESAAITKHIGNPWPGVLKRVMHLLGADDPFHDPSIDNPRDIERRIKELVGKRNEIAHGSGTPSLTHQQLDQYLEAVEIIARVLDEQAAAIVQRVCSMPTRPWS